MKLTLNLIFNPKLHERNIPKVSLMLLFPLNILKYASSVLDACPQIDRVPKVGTVLYRYAKNLRGKRLALRAPRVISHAICFLENIDWKYLQVRAHFIYGVVAE